MQAIKKDGRGKREWEKEGETEKKMEHLLLLLLSTFFLLSPLTHLKCCIYLHSSNDDDDADGNGDKFKGHWVNDMCLWPAPFRFLFFLLFQISRWERGILEGMKKAVEVRMKRNKKRGKTMWTDREIALERWTERMGRQWTRDRITGRFGDIRLISSDVICIGILLLMVNNVTWWTDGILGRKEALPASPFFHWRISNSSVKHCHVKNKQSTLFTSKGPNIRKQKRKKSTMI